MAQSQNSENGEKKRVHDRNNLFSEWNWAKQTKSLDQERFFLVCFQHYCQLKRGMYKHNSVFVPAEMAIVEFSFREGIVSTKKCLFNINTSTLTQDELTEAKERYFDVHGLWVLDESQKSPFREAYRLLRNIMRKQSHIFCLEKEWASVHGCIKYILKNVVMTRKSKQKPFLTKPQDELVCLETLIRAAIEWEEEKKDGSTTLDLVKSEWDVEPLDIAETVMENMPLAWVSHQCSNHGETGEKGKFGCAVATATLSVETVCKWFKAGVIESVRREPQLPERPKKGGRRGERRMRNYVSGGQLIWTSKSEESGNNRSNNAKSNRRSNSGSVATIRRDRNTTKDTSDEGRSSPTLEDILVQLETDGELAEKKREERRAERQRWKQEKSNRAGRDRNEDQGDFDLQREQTKGENEAERKDRGWKTTIIASKNAAQGGNEPGTSGASSGVKTSESQRAKEKKNGELDNGQSSESDESESLSADGVLSENEVKNLLMNWDQKMKEAPVGRRGIGRGFKGSTMRGINAHYLVAYNMFMPKPGNG